MTNKVIPVSNGLTEKNNDPPKKNTSAVMISVCKGILKAVTLLGCLYFFICSLDLLSAGFRLIAGAGASELFKTPALSNPFAGLVIGIVFTALINSSSTSTSIIVSMVSAEIIPTVRIAIPMIMGANVGTTVTSVIVALTNIANKKRFRAAFSAATMHDMFNLLSVLVLLIVEIAFHYLEELSSQIVKAIDFSATGEIVLLNALTKPLTDLIVKLDLTKITKEFENNGSTSFTLLKENSTSLFNPNTGWEDWAIGLLLLIVSLAVLIACLALLVKVLGSILQGSVEKFTKKIINSDLPGFGKYFTGYLFMLIGCGVTFLVQSSSVFISILIPLVALGTVELERIFPLCLGANIGTTITGIMSALSSGGTQQSFQNSLQIALCHTIFNITGILIWYPIPFLRKVPISLAKMLGKTSAEYRWFAIFYLIMIFFVVPLTVFGLSLAGDIVLYSVLGPISLLVFIIIIVNLMQNKYSKFLPKFLKTWEFLPLPMRSLKPYDNFFNKYICFCACLHKAEEFDEETEIIESIQVETNENKDIFMTKYNNPDQEIETSYL